MSDMLVSSPFGEFDPFNPRNIPGIFAVNVYTEPVEIDAPIHTVWDIMTDFEHYYQWNPINIFFRLDTEAAPNHYVTFCPSWGPYPKTEGDPLPLPDMIQHEMITVWEEDCCLAYATISRPNNAERVQHISTLENGKTRYHTYERMSGLISPLVRLLYRKKIIAGFTANGQALKKRAEAFAAAGSGVGAA